LVRSQAECATKVWQQPDQGIWEARGKPQHYVSSKLMCWVALDRAAKLAQIRGDSDLEATWRATAEQIRADILEHGVALSPTDTMPLTRRAKGLMAAESLISYIVVILVISRAVSVLGT
jgi:GH15 family glucan-1,4-alpha-glucosidase